MSDRWQRSQRYACSGSTQEVIAEAQEAMGSVGSEKFILAPGCGVTIDTPDENLKALRRSVD